MRQAERAAWEAANLGRTTRRSFRREVLPRLAEVSIHWDSGGDGVVNGSGMEDQEREDAASDVVGSTQAADDRSQSIMKLEELQTRLRPVTGEHPLDRHTLVTLRAPRLFGIETG